MIGVKKKVRFWGLHFDFHAKNEQVIGNRTNAEDIAWYIEQAQPDFVQCDCKGHPGNSSYPTKVGKAADRLEKDNLRVWVDTVHKYGLPIYVHYSGVWDKEYTKAHPEDAAVDKEGRIREEISLFGPYVDKLLIPQIKELITEYQIDGMWVDGECWAIERDFSEHAKPYLWEGMSKKEHRQVMREAFFRYVKRYVDELHAFAPGFQITSNWMYSSYIPQKPEVDIDFISGDYPPVNSVHEARYEGRCIAAQGKAWDLMAWSFTLDYWMDKSAVQLMQEAAMVLMLGGGFQLYITQNTDGSARKMTGNRLKELGAFVRARELNYQKKTVAQVGVFFSAESYYEGSNIFSACGVTDSLKGILNGILDAGYTANIILEYQLDTLHQYEMVVVPEWKSLSGKVIQVLLSYVQEGGKLLIAGAEVSVRFGEKIGQKFEKVCELVSDPTKTLSNYRWLMDEAGYFFGLTDTAIVDLKSGKDYIYTNHDMRDRALPAYRVDTFGAGSILFIPFDMGKIYANAQAYGYVNFIKKTLGELAAPLVEMNRKNIDISLQEDGDAILLNLVNMNQGRHSLSVMVYDEIPPCYDVEVLVHKSFREVSMPLGEAFDCEYGEDYVKIVIHKLDIHSIICMK